MPSGEEELQETRPQPGRAVDAQQSEAERCQQQQDHDEQPQLGGRSVVEEDGHDDDGGEDKEHQELAKDLQDELLFIPGLGEAKANGDKLSRHGKAEHQEQDELDEQQEGREDHEIAAILMRHGDDDHGPRFEAQWPQAVHGSPHLSSEAFDAPEQPPKRRPR